MRTLKKIFNFMFSRLFLVALMLLFQVLLVVVAVYYFSQSVFYVYLFCLLLSVLVVLAIVSNNENPSYKIAWIIVILTFPVIGGIFYLLFGNKRMPGKLQRRMDETLEGMQEYFPSNTRHLGKLDNHSSSLALQSQYIYNVSGFPMCAGTSSKYFAVGELMFDQMLTELRQAKKYIMLEYFIVRPGFMWDTIFHILKQKIREGVDVYMMYDDLGSISTLPKVYDKVIRKAGVKLCVFNPFRPRASVILNYRDHRKIAVIDGQTAFCGGINLADEYINHSERFGHWKDTGIMLKGEGAWHFTLLYLQQWQFGTGEILDFEAFRPEVTTAPGDGLVQVFGDSPLDDINVTEVAYLNIISKAKKYVYITTPYLVIDYEMEQALCAAAASGVDVRIITPYHYDKWYVHMLTRSHYQRLIQAGVKIYEYTPGFMHGKMFVSDDCISMIGTCNMDFRSFYLHFECSVVFYHARLIQKVKRDMLDCQKISHKVTLEETQQVRFSTRLLRSILKMFAPLM